MEIEFRGKRLNDGKWIYGTPVSDEKNSFIITLYNRYCDADSCVIPETVGQYTGKNDKNDKKIYEGDVVRLAHKDTHKAIINKNFVVNWKDASFVAGDDLALTNVLEVIGNIHDVAVEV